MIDYPLDVSYTSYVHMGIPSKQIYSKFTFVTFVNIYKSCTRIIDGVGNVCSVCLLFLL